MKKVAFFIGEITKEYQLNLTVSMARFASQNGIKLYVFANHGTYGTDMFYSHGERSIMDIPDFSIFDGVLCITDTFEVTGMDEQFMERVHEKVTCPVISIRRKEKDCYSVVYDDTQATYELTRHFIEHHGFKDICYMTGTITTQDAKARLKGFLKAMNEFGLETPEHNIFYGNYWRNRGDEALEWFFEGRSKLPQAIICANDYMAIAICEALKKRNLRVPEDVCVSGFDDLEEARYYYPSLTSMSVDGSTAGVVALQMMIDLWQGEKVSEVEYIKLKPAFRASCGCTTGYDASFLGNVFQLKEWYRSAMDLTTYMFIGYDSCHTLQELLIRAQSSLRPVGYDRIYVCLCDESERVEERKDKYTDHMILKAIMTMDGVEFTEEVFERSEILPEKYSNTAECAIVSTIHEKDDCLGYVVVYTKHVDKMECMYRSWLIGFSNALSRLKMYEENQMLEEIRKQYVTDPLTGISNRRGFEKIMQGRVEQLYNTGKGFCFFSLDMDGLKYINDTFGHSVGDEALIAFAHILQDVVNEQGECARIGGDEFWACISTEDIVEAEEFCKELRKEIDAWNEDNQKQYVLSASIGYSFCNRRQSLTSCMEIADQNMYIDKAKRKKERRN